MSSPMRIQLSRVKGFRLQEWSRDLNGLPAVKVDRTTRWGNPFRSGLYGHHRAVHMHREWIQEPFQADLRLALADLRGKNLACWCRGDQPCHGDALLELANP